MFGKKKETYDPLKERIAKHLRTADEFIRNGQYGEAMLEVEAVLRIDPKNYYARSFQERIRYFQKKQSQQMESQTEKMDRKVEIVSQLLKTADKYIELKEYKRALDQVAKVFAIDPHNYFAQSYSDRIEMMIQQEHVEFIDARNRPLPQRPPAPPPPQRHKPKLALAPENEKASIAMYRELLREMWFDGKLTAEESEELGKVRDTFGISLDEHGQLEKEVKVDAYVEALRIAWRDNEVSKNEKEVLEMMRKKYGITLEEHLSAEAKILWAKGTPSARGTILIVDDDRTLLLSVDATLKKHGYDVSSAESVEDALKILESRSPALILSDVMFPEPGMTGLEFYKRVREDPKLSGIPFLLMSGISDEFVVRAGMRLGVDNFITKPFNFELLLATIDGRIKQR